MARRSQPCVKGPLVQQAEPTNSRKRPTATWHPSVCTLSRLKFCVESVVRTDFIPLGSVTTNRKNGLTGEQLVAGTADSRSVSRKFSVLTEGCHVRYSWEFAGTVSNTTKVLWIILCFSVPGPPIDGGGLPVPYACPLEHLVCGSGECIYTSRVCNGHQDCSDNSDETDCPGMILYGISHILQ